VLAYSLFAIRVSIFLHLGHSKESNSWPGLSASIPNNNIPVPHFEQSGRLIELECAVAGWYVVISPSHIYFLAGVYEALSHRALAQR
jgi:hypothetical protein